MSEAFIISEYKWQGHKQALLERVKNTYRVIIVKRFNSLDEAREVYLAEIPEVRLDDQQRTIDAYAAKHKPQAKTPKGKRHAKSDKTTA